MQLYVYCMLYFMLVAVCPVELQEGKHAMSRMV